MASPAAERYVRLGLQLGRHVDGMVDSYYGPAELAAEVDAAPPVELAGLVADAEALLADLEEGWLHDQVMGLRTYAGVLAGEVISYADEVERCDSSASRKVRVSVCPASWRSHFRRSGSGSMVSPDSPEAHCTLAA